MPRSQTAKDRPILFVLHNLTDNSEPVTFPLVIRPEDLTRSESSRMSVHQTLGGAWADSFGESVPTITMAGHTGWGAGTQPDGFFEFQKLHDTIFSQWHALREAAVINGKDPDLVNLIFSDGLDDFTWIVAPSSFVLRRNKSRPLLSQYQINLTKLADDITPMLPSKSPLADADKQALGVKSLQSSIGAIEAFGKSLGGKISAVLGPITKGLQSLVALTSKILKSAIAIVQSTRAALNSTTAPLLQIAALATKAAKNVTGIIAAIKSIPADIRASFMRVSAAFSNAMCTLKNVFKAKAILPDYDSVYGASNCSSTTGARGISSYYPSSANVFSDIHQKPADAVSASPAALQSMSALAAIDGVKTPANLPAMNGLIKTAVSGITVAS